MLKKPKRLKAPAVAVAVPQSAREANCFIELIGLAQRERARIEVDMNEEMARVKAAAETNAAPHKAQIEALSAGLQTWCEAHRAELTYGGKVKTHRFAAGEVAWRMCQPSVAIKKIEDVLKALHDLGLKHFIRKREEIDKEAMLADRAAAATVPGVTIRAGVEEFVVKPFETQLEEVGSVSIAAAAPGHAEGSS
jgi:phage host-nuclease inhibitor protein Gam